MENLARRLGIENLSGGQASEATKGHYERVWEFRDRSLFESVYPVLRADAPYEKVQINGGLVGITCVARN